MAGWDSTVAEATRTIGERRPSASFEISEGLGLHVNITRAENGKGAAGKGGGAEPGLSQCPSEQRRQTPRTQGSAQRWFKRGRFTLESAAVGQGAHPWSRRECRGRQTERDAGDRAPVGKDLAVQVAG